MLLPGITTRYFENLLLTIKRNFLMHLTVSSFLTVQLEPENRHMSYVGLPVPKALDRKGLLIQTERFEINQA